MRGTPLPYGVAGPSESASVSALRPRSSAKHECSGRAVPQSGTWPHKPGRETRAQAPAGCKVTQSGIVEFAQVIRTVRRLGARVSTTVDRGMNWPNDEITDLIKVVSASLRLRQLRELPPLVHTAGDVQRFDRQCAPRECDRPGPSPISLQRRALRTSCGSDPLG